MTGGAAKDAAATLAAEQPVIMYNKLMLMSAPMLPWYNEEKTIARA